MVHERDLAVAIVKGTVDDIEALIAQGADPRKLLNHGLGLAITRPPYGPCEVAPGRTVMAPNMRYRLKVLKCLLDHGADTNQDVLYSAIHYGDADVVKMLLDYGVNAHDMNEILWKVTAMVYSTTNNAEWTEKLWHLLLHMRKVGAPIDDAVLSWIAKGYPWISNLTGV